MKNNKKIGIYMDHQSAHLVEYSAKDGQHTSIDSAFTHQQKEEALKKSEHTMHNKEQHQQAEYYKKITDEILKYDDILLFGPTEAKTELYNTIKDNHLFKNIKIHIKQTDKQTENQKHEFVKTYFTT